MKTKSILAPSLLVLSSTLLANELYKVRPNDILTRVLVERKLSPLYGEQGSLNKTIALNPKLKKDRGNKIYIGEEILLPIDPPVSTPSFPLEKASSPKVYTNLGFGLISSELKDSSGMSGTIDSKNYFVMNIGLIQEILPKLTARFQLDLHHITLAEAKGIKHSKNDFTLLGYGFDFQKDLSVFKVNLGLGTKPIILPYEKTPQEIKVDSYLLKFGRLGISKDFSPLPNITNTIELNGLYVPPSGNSTIKIKHGHGFEGSFKTRYKKNQWVLGGEISFTQLDYKTDISKAKTQIGIISLGASYDF